MAQDLNKNFEKEKPGNEGSVESRDSAIGTEKATEIKETTVEKESSKVEKSAEEKKPLEKLGEVFVSKTKKKTVTTSSDIERQKQIDLILSEDLNDIFLNMSPIQQKKFKEEGEKTVKKINNLLNNTKIKLKKIIDLIKKWLKMIPKINIYFLEQEAKIKADKIAKLKK